jgi:putative hydrolase of HD superfamily
MVKRLTNLIFEGLHLKNVKHEGWRLCGIPAPDSVAEHSLNAAQIGYVLAKMEGADANKVAAMLVWHDLAETRVGDHHKIAARYITGKREIEGAVMKDQLEGIDFGADIADLFAQYEDRSTLEGTIAKDADYLEQAFQGKVYVETGYHVAQKWIENVGKALRTESAKKLWKEMTESHSTDWWLPSNLPKIEGGPYR